MGCVFGLIFALFFNILVFFVKKMLCLNEVLMMLKPKNSLRGIALWLIIISFKVTAINIDFNQHDLLTELETTEGVLFSLDNGIDTGEGVVVNSTKWWFDSSHPGDSTFIMGARYTPERLMFDFDYVVQDFSSTERSQPVFDNDFNNERDWPFGVSSIFAKIVPKIKMTVSEPALMILLGLGLIGLGFSINRKS